MNKDTVLKLMSIVEVFKKGQAVANPTLWKNRQVTTTVLVAIIFAVINMLSVFGYTVYVDIDTANIIATCIIAVVNVVLTYATSDKIGTKDDSDEVK